QPVQTNAASQRRFAVALTFLDIGATKTPRSIHLSPSEDRADDEILWRLGMKRLAFELAFAQPKFFLEKPQTLRSGRFIKSDVVSLEIVQMTPTGISHMRAFNYLAAKSQLRVSGRPVSRQRTRLSACLPAQSGCAHQSGQA